MGLPITPQDAAPAYDDVFGDHPVDRYTSSRSVSAYAAVPQEDDVELHAHDHNPASSSSSSIPPSQPETFAQTMAGVLRPKHVHCEQCDVQLAARQRREQEKHCCNMVAATFTAAFVCIFVGVMVTSSILSKNRPHD